MELNEMRVRVEEMLDELAERNFSCLNDGWNFNQLSVMLAVIEKQLAGNVNAGYNARYGKIWHVFYPHAREEVARNFPGMVRNYEKEV